jgi:hypothetical protein
MSEAELHFNDAMWEELVLQMEGVKMEEGHEWTNARGL